MQGVGFPDSLNSAPPPCLASHESCRAKPQDCNSTTAQNWFHHTARLHSPALDNPSASSLRVFFLDGHSGPLNDMLAFLQGMGGGTADATADALRFSGMVFGQAIDHLEHIDGPSFTDRRCRGGALGTNLSHRRSPCSTRMPPATFHEAFHQYHSSGASQPPQPMPPPPDVCLHVLAPLLAPNSTSTRPPPHPTQGACVPLRETAVGKRRLHSCTGLRPPPLPRCPIRGFSRERVRRAIRARVAAGSA
jgi:hypothetical protein